MRNHLWNMMSCFSTTGQDGTVVFTNHFPRDTDAGGAILVCDTENHRLQCVNAAGEYVSAVGTVGSGDGQFINPVGVAIDSRGNLFVVDASNNRVQKLAADGSYLGQFGSNDDGEDHYLGVPMGLAIDAEDNLYIVDVLEHWVKKFPPQGSCCCRSAHAVREMDSLNLPGRSR
jgi:DNA-binding beta-propeller fold protein YncE